MNQHLSRLSAWGVLASALLVLAVIAPLTAPLQVEAQSPTGSEASAVVPLNSPYAGKSYAQWSAAWWQWSLTIPVHTPPCDRLGPSCRNPITHPLIYPTTGNCGAGQSGPVWFLGGVFFTADTPAQPVSRNCTVPGNTALFFPIVNSSCSELEVTSAPNNYNNCGTDKSETGLRSYIKPWMDTATDLRAEIDGVAVWDVSRYRVLSGPGCFSYTLPVDNILRFFGEIVPANTPSGCAVADGYYLLLRPLSAGAHTLHFHSVLPAFGNYTLDVRYALTVGPGGQ